MKPKHAKIITTITLFALATTITACSNENTQPKETTSIENNKNSTDNNETSTNNMKDKNINNIENAETNNANVIKLIDNGTFNQQLARQREKLSDEKQIKALALAFLELESNNYIADRVKNKAPETINSETGEKESLDAPDEKILEAFEEQELSELFMPLNQEEKDYLYESFIIVYAFSQTFNGGEFGKLDTENIDFKDYKLEYSNNKKTAKLISKNPIDLFAQETIDNIDYSNPNADVRYVTQNCMDMIEFVKIDNTWYIKYKKPEVRMG